MRNLFLVLSILFACAHLNAQLGINWEYNYGSPFSEEVLSIQATNDGGYIMIGVAGGVGGDVSSNNLGGDVWLVKTDQNGILEWEQSYGGSLSDWGLNVSQTSDSGFILLGNSMSDDFDVSANNGGTDLWIIKTDVNGNLLWEQNYGGPGHDNIGGPDANGNIVQTPDGGYIVCGNSSTAGGDVTGNYGDADIWLLKLDDIGNIIWEQNYGGNEQDVGSRVFLTDDGGYLAFGRTSSQALGQDVGGNNGFFDVWVFKTDSLGVLEWEQNYGGSLGESAASIEKTSDGAYIITGYSESNDFDVSGNNGNSDAWLLKIDQNGAIEWEQNYGGSGYEAGYSVKETLNGGFVIVGKATSNDFDVSWNYGVQDVWVFETDSLGNLLSEQNFGGTDEDFATGVIQKSNGNFIVVSKTLSTDFNVSANNGSSDIWIFETKPFIGSIQGSIFNDNNENCIYESGDTVLNNIIVYAVNDSSLVPAYGYTNSLGEYLLEADTASYTVHYSLPSIFYEGVACSPNTQSVQLSATNLIDTADFYIHPIIDCPLMTVDISAPLLRRCMSSDYIVSYCNQGTLPADSSYVVVEFDPNLIIDSTSIPWDSVYGNTYTFLIGDINIFECGSFSVSITVKCDSTFIGEILCSEAHIFPDSVCLPDTSSWNGAQLRAMAKCIGTDTVEFELKNIGTGNMGGDVPIIAIEDVILIIDDQVQLNAGVAQTWKVPINGNTQRIIAGQPTNHPFLNFTTDAVSFCNKNGIVAPGPIMDSSFLSYPNDEESPFIAVDCQEVIGAYDPNDKSVSPRGVSSEHFISETMDLEYKIRFQNTGNDTAFTVIITDSISARLDITTIRPGAASHPYVMDIYGNGVLKFTFDNILLVDSFTNEPKSHGFVQYKIAQNAGNQVGDVINNNADIFFDFNPAIRTNTVFNKIGGMILDTMIYTEPVGLREISIQDIHVYPNPAVDFMIFDLGKQFENISLELYDATGNLIHQTISRNNQKLKLNRYELPAGVYFFRLAINGVINNHGTVIFQ